MNKPISTATQTALSSKADASALTSYATTASLSSYATTASLSSYATTASLSSYATTASLSNYATTASLSNYATTASLSSYAPKNNPSFTGIPTGLFSVASAPSITASYSDVAGTMRILTNNGNFTLYVCVISGNGTTSTNGVWKSVALATS